LNSLTRVGKWTIGPENWEKTIGKEVAEGGEGYRESAGTKTGRKDGCNRAISGRVLTCHASKQGG